MTAGTRLGPFELMARAGAGGMGEVYKAHDSRLNRTVAVKVLKPGVTTPDRLRRFELEAQAASALNHPNILTIYDVGRDGDVVYLATEWVEGSTLREVIDGPPLAMPRVVDLAHQVAEGLARAHAAGIVHRDIKPENVMVSDDGLVKIVDFGLAKLAAAGDIAADQSLTHSALTMAGVVMGTVGYLSPEQASGRAVDHRADQFALGLLIYEMATRRQPFARPTAAQSLAATIEAEPPPIDAVNPEVPPPLAAVVARCLAKNPADRYESTRDVARALKGILDGPPPGTRTAAEATRRSPGRRGLLAAAGAALAAVLATAWLWWPTAVAPSDVGRPLVAVRAFRNLSADAAQSYFAAGMSEEISGQLSQLSGLRLLSRAAVAQYGDGDIDRLRRDLGVGSVVDGSVRVAGPRVRITVQLIDTANQQTLWSGNYDRGLADVFAVQSDVAIEVAHALQATLTPAEQQRVARRPTANLEAYQLYLRWTQAPATGREEWHDSLGLLRQAIALDRSFVAARSSLAYSLIQRSTFYDDGAAYLAEGMAEAEAVLKQDPTAARAHSALATGYAITGVASQARLSFQRALTLDPNDTLAMNNLSTLEVYFGRYVDGLDWARRGFEGSGKLGNDYYHVSVPLISLRDDPLSWRWLTEAEGRADHARVQQQLALVEVLGGRDQDATARLARAAKRDAANIEVTQTRSEVAFLIDSDEQEALVAPLITTSAGTIGVWLAETPRLRYAYALARRGEAARSARLVGEAERQARAKIDGGDEMPLWRVELAAIHALKQDRAAALDALARAYDAGYREYGYLERDPIFAPLRADGRFRDLLDRMRRDVETQRQAARERGLFDIDALLARPR